jgi:phage gp36-like protein
MDNEFLTENDFDVQVRQEILSLLDGSDEKTAVALATRMATDQITQYIGGKYDCKTIFAQTGEDRDHFIVMITIDILLYHLWSKRAPRKIPEYRSTRYQDALDWLKAVGSGELQSALPQLPPDEYQGRIIIKSKYEANNNKY